MNHQSIRRATAALAAGGLAVTGMLAAAPGAWAAEGQDGQQVGASTLSRLVALNPGVTKRSMLQAIEAEAKASGLPASRVAAAVLAEAESSAAESAEVRPNTSSSGGSGTATLGSGRYKGDVFYSPASTLFVNHGHSGIFYTTATIVHAPGSGQVSRSGSASAMNVASGAQKQYVMASQTERNTAANYAYNNLRDRPYNSNFAFNRKNSNEVNCSQLVWLAYRETSGRDLDSNAGTGVYPANIRDSQYTTTYQTL